MAKAGHEEGSKTASQSDDAFHQYKCERYGAHIANRQNLNDLAFKTSERYDQWVITLAGGALAISLTFLEKIVHHPIRNTVFLLALSWLAYILAILAGFCAIHYSRNAIYRAIEICDETYRLFIETSTDQNPGGDPSPDLKNRASEIVSYLNKASLLCLIIGTVLMCAFALMNMDVKDSTTSEAPKDFVASGKPTHVTNSTQLTNTSNFTNTNVGKP